MSQIMLSTTELLTEFVNNLEKKQRNLIKRKTKLDGYRKMIQQGETLTNEQNKAVGDYLNVSYSIVAMKEVADGLNELQAKINCVEKETEKQLTLKHHEFALNTLANLVPVFEILSKIQSPIVKAAVIKVSSPQQYKVLEMASKLIYVQFPSGIESTELNRELFKEPSLNMLQFGTCASVSIQSAKGNKLRTPTFSDVREICLNLLNDPNVRNALIAPFVEPIVVKKKTLVRSDASKILEQTPVVDPQSVKVEPVSEVMQPKVQEKVSPNYVHRMPSEAILDSVINPLKTNFNFLQASHVDAAPMWQVQIEQVLQKPIDPSNHSSMVNATQQNQMNHQNIVEDHQQSHQILHQPYQNSQYLESSQTQYNEQQHGHPNLHVDLNQQSHIEHQEKPQPIHHEVSVENKPQVFHKPQEHQQEQQPHQPQKKQHNETITQESPKVVKKPSELTEPKKKRNKREKAVGRTTHQHQDGPTSLQAVMDAEVLLEAKPSQKAKSWADLCGGGNHPPVMAEVPKPALVNINPTHMEHHQNVENPKEQPPFHRRDDTSRPRGGYRGGRGRGFGEHLRGGRGPSRGSYHNERNRGDFSNGHPEPVQSIC